MQPDRQGWTRLGGAQGCGTWELGIPAVAARAQRGTDNVKNNARQSIKRAGLKAFIETNARTTHQLSATSRRRDPAATAVSATSAHPFENPYVVDGEPPQMAGLVAKQPMHRVRGCSRRSCGGRDGGKSLDSSLAPGQSSAE
jgi:hypothetical protein